MDNYKSIFKSILLTVFLAMLTLNSTHAQDNGGIDKFESSENIIQSIFSANVVFEGENKDLAHSYFAQLFGEFIFVNWGVGDANDVTLLSKVLGFTNILALILGIIIVYYVIVGGAVNTAQAGEVLGKSWSSVWLPLRVSAGFGSIMPANLGDGNPFSVAQIFILWLIMIGSNGATVLWNTTVDAMANGARPSATMHTVPQTDSIENFKILMCAEEQLNYWGRDTDKPQQVALITGVNRGSAVHPKRDLSTTGGSGKHSIADIDFSSIGKNMDYIQSIQFMRGCGTISIPSPADAFTKTNSSQDSAAWVGGAVASNYKVLANWAGIQSTYDVIGRNLNANRDLVLKFREITKGESQDLITRRKNNHQQANNLFEATAISLNKNSLAYSTEMNKAISSSVEAILKSDKGIVDEMKRGGWVVAGKWFYEMSAAADLKNGVVGQVAGSSSYQSPDLCTISTDWFFFQTGDSNCKTYKHDYFNTKEVMNILHRDAIDIAKNEKQPIAFNESVINHCSEDECDNDEGITNRLSTTASSWFLNLLTTGDVKATDGSVNPFTTLSSLGHHMNNLGVGAWGVGMLLYTYSEVTRGAGEGFPTKALLAPTFAPMTYIGATLIPLMASMLTLGFTLAYVIPFLPVMTWIIMVIGYLVTTIEAVVASPLAVILMVTPEGEGISGTRLERAMQLITMAVLKPSLMVIGVIASISVSYVAFAVVNRFFWETAEYVLHGSILDIVAVTSIYVIIAFQVVRLLVSVMYRLPDQILDWFSSGVGRQFGENEVGGMAEKTGNEMKAGASQVAGGAGGLFGEKRRNALYQQSRQNTQPTTNADKE